MHDAFVASLRGQHQLDHVRDRDSARERAPLSVPSSVGRRRRPPAPLPVVEEGEHAVEQGDLEDPADVVVLHDDAQPAARGLTRFIAPRRTPSVIESMNVTSLRSTTRSWIPSSITAAIALAQLGRPVQVRLAGQDEHRSGRRESLDVDVQFAADVPRAGRVHGLIAHSLTLRPTGVNGSAVGRDRVVSAARRDGYHRRSRPCARGRSAVSR